MLKCQLTPFLPWLNVINKTSDSLANVQSNSTEVQGSSACVKKGYWDISAEYYVSTHCNSFKVYKS